MLVNQLLSFVNQMTPNNMISLAEARAMIAQTISPLPPQPAALAMEFARVLREDVDADEDLPAFDRSAMDGYAVALDDVSEKFRLIGEIQPGVFPAFKINHGECARIFTGAQIPEGASQVLMQENVRVENGFIIPTQRSQVAHIRWRGARTERSDARD